MRDLKLQTRMTDDSIIKKIMPFNMNKIISSIFLVFALLNIQSGLKAQVQPLDSFDDEFGNPDSRQDRSGENARASDYDISAQSVFDPVALGPNSVDGVPLAERESQQPNLLGSNVASRLPEPSEFEAYVEQLAGRKVRRFGQNLLLDSSRDFALPSTAVIPPNYRLNVGDTVSLNLTGSVSGTVEREIDNEGNIFLPSVGIISLAGTQYSDLRNEIAIAVGRQFRNFDVSVSIKALRGVRVYVTGFANNPGAFTLTSLATLTNAVLQAGGPASGGSFRSIKLYRNGRELGNFDLYDLLRNASREGDVVLQNEDVLFIPPAGQQVAVLGSVQDEAIYELIEGETLSDALQLAGGPNVLAEQERLILYRTSDLVNREPIQIQAAQASNTLAEGGDILEVLSIGSIIHPIASQSLVVRIEGEVARPGNYYLPPQSTLEDLVEMAGGFTERAFVFGSKLTRASVREQQQISYNQALEQFRQALATAPLEGTIDNNAGRRVVELQSAREFLDLLSERQPDGRVVMALSPRDTTLPSNTLLENNDSVIIPAKPSTVGVFGAVYRPSSFLIEEQNVKLGEYIERAGNTLRAADRRRSFVVRANGEILTAKKGMLRAPALPGDVVFVPVRSRSNDFWTKLQNITSVIFQLGITAGVVDALR